MDKLEAARKMLEDERSRHEQLESQLRTAEAQAREAAEKQLQDGLHKAEASVQNTIDSLKVSPLYLLS